MHNQSITRILFQDDTLIRVVSDDDFKDSEDITQKAADHMAASGVDPYEITEEQQMEYVLIAADLPKDLFDRDIAYVREDEVCEFVKYRLAPHYRIGLLTFDPLSARLALGDRYKDIIDDFVDVDDANSVNNHFLYFSDDSVLVTRDTTAVDEIAGVCRIHQYRDVRGLERYLASPPPFVAPPLSNPTARAATKRMGLGIERLGDMSKRSQYIVDLIIIVVLLWGVWYLFPNESKQIWQSIKEFII